MIWIILFALGLFAAVILFSVPFLILEWFLRKAFGWAYGSESRTIEPAKAQARRAKLTQPPPPIDPAERLRWANREGEYGSGGSKAD